jgi:FAD/FMN-containing dehydrogenase/Fe-S oxidoreductase
MSESDLPTPAAAVDAEGLRAALAASIEGEVRFDRISQALYSTDASVYQILPLGVVIPKTRDDVIRTIKICRQFGVSITARGGGTSQAGQAIGAGVQLDFSKYLHRVLTLEPEAQRVRVEPGIVLDELNAFLKPYNLLLPLDISTSDRATIGGMIANNSSGTRSVVYGKTLDYVLSLTAVLSDGSVVELCPVDSQQLAAKCAQTDLEGACYRVVQRLGTEHAAEIERRYPRILRRVGGYNLDEFVPGRQPFNLSRLLVGSEGTLAIVLDATLRLVSPPKQRAMCVVQFHDLLESLAATPVILRHQPSAVELVDRFILDSTRGKTEFEPLRSFIAGDPAAVLFVEFMGDSPSELAGRVAELEQTLQTAGLGYHVHRALEPAAQAKLWKLRQAALGLSMSEHGDAKAISFVEDTAVAPDRLRDYIARFQQILERHATRAGFYAHASVGLLHVRPVVNLKQADGVSKFASIAEQISDLVLEFGGALSGEHGDGLARSPFQQKMYGPTLYRAFCELKHTFDPTGLFNPGKIIEAPPLTGNLRFGPRYVTRPIDTAFDFSEFGGLSQAAEQCGGIGACRKKLTGTMCPSYMATRDENDSTRGRANVLRLAISGQLGPIGLTDPALYPVLDLCLECKACKSECPTGVDLARMKSEFLHQYRLRHGPSARSRLLANIDRLAVWGSRLAPVSNWLAASFPVRWLADVFLGLDRRRVPPAFVRRTFLDWWATEERRSEQGHRDGKPRLALFADTFTNFHEPAIPMAAVRLAAVAGWSVSVPARVCCGRPLISKGFLDDARRQAEQTVQTLLPLAEEGLPIVFCEPGCYSAVRDDHPQLLRGELKENARRVATACLTFEEWAGQLTLPLRPGPDRVLMHAHCHQKALVGTGPALRLLNQIPHCEVVDLDAGCCGMAGSFGYEREHYEISRAVGERKLFPAVRAAHSGTASPSTAVVASGFSCRHQLAHFATTSAVHPAVFLHALLNQTDSRQQLAHD